MTIKGTCSIHCTQCSESAPYEGVLGDPLQHSHLPRGWIVRSFIDEIWSAREGTLVTRTQTHILCSECARDQMPAMHPDVRQVIEHRERP